MANDAPEGEAPEVIVTPEQMRDELLKQLYQNRKDLKGIALVNGIKALRDLIPPAPPKEPDDATRFSILDQLGSLPVAESRRLLTEEIARIRTDLVEHETALETLEA